MQPPSGPYDGHTASSVSNVFQPAPSESSSHPHDPSPSQATRLSVHPYAFSRIGHGQQMMSDVRHSAPPSSYQQHLEQHTPFGVPTRPAILSQPWLMTAPPIGDNVPSNSTMPPSPSHPSASPAVSSYDPALNDAYLRFFNDDRAELPRNLQEGLTSRSSQGQPQGGPTQPTPSGPSLPVAPPSQPPLLRRPPYSIATSSSSRSRPSSLASSIVAPWLASKTNVAPSVTSPVHATPTFSSPTQKFGPVSSSSTSGALWDPSSVTATPSHISSNIAGLASMPSVPRPIPSTPRVERPHGTQSGGYFPHDNQTSLQPVEVTPQPYPSHFQPPPPPATSTFLGFPPPWGDSSQVPASPVPGCSECTGGQTPYYPTADNWSAYPQHNADASSVFRFSVDDASQSIPPTPQMASSHEMPAQGGILPGNQDQAQSAEIAELPYQGMPPPPPVDAALSYSSFGSLPQTRLLTSWGDSDHTGSHVPHPHPSAPAVRPYSRTPQSSQMATGPLPVPATPHAGQPRILPAGAHVDVMPEPGRQTATNTVQIPPAPPQPEKRKASASPPSEATRVQVQSGSQKKRAKKGKGKATDPSAEPGDAVEDVPTLPGETLAAAQSRVRREKKRAKRIQDLYDEIAPLIPPSRTNRKLSEDDILRHAKDIVNGVRAHEDDRSKQIGHLMKAKWTAQSELQEERIKSETTEQTLEATRRWGEETLLRLETTIQESESMREGSERLRVERDGAVIQLEEVNGELERTRTQLKTSIEEKRQIEVQARRSADQAKRLTHEKQELYDELQSVKAELQRYRLTVIGCSK